MKKKMQKIKSLLIIYVLISSFSSKAEIGCMAKSKRLNTANGYDYKQLEYVSCSCPCSSYVQDRKRAMCTQCLHFHKPSELVLITSQKAND